MGERGYGLLWQTVRHIENLIKLIFFIFLPFATPANMRLALLALVAVGSCGVVNGNDGSVTLPPPPPVLLIPLSNGGVPLGTEGIDTSTHPPSHPLTLSRSNACSTVSDFFENKPEGNQLEQVGLPPPLLTPLPRRPPSRPAHSIAWSALLQRRVPVDIEPWLGVPLLRHSVGGHRCARSAMGPPTVLY